MALEEVSTTREELEILSMLDTEDVAELELVLLSLEEVLIASEEDAMLEGGLASLP